MPLVAQDEGAKSAESETTATKDPDVVDSETREAGVGELPEAFDFVAFPIVAFTPETSFVLAGAGLFFFKISDDPDTPRSDLLTTAAYTLRGQGVVQIEPSFFFGDGAWEFSTAFLFLDWPSDFFGIKGDTVEEPVEYNNLQAEGEFIVNRRIFENVYAGLAYEISYSDLTLPQDSDLFTADLPGREGGLISGIGIRFRWDTRDTRFATTEGSRFSVESTNFNEAFGGDFTYTKSRVDLRHFMNWSNHTLGLHAVTRLTMGDPPFYDMSTIGGSNQLRGVFSGKFVDNHMYVLQSEYRTPYLLWRFGLAAFAGVGQTFAHLEDITPSAWEWGAGGGIRFAVREEERVNIRLDFGYAEDGLSIYFGLAEAF